MTIEGTSASASSRFAYLDKEQYAQLTTFRKSGAGVATPVWVANDPANPDTIYVVTPSGSGKIKRLRNNDRVVLVPCDRRGIVHGSEVEGKARVLAEAEHKRANEVIAKKFGFMYKIFGLVGIVSRSKRTFLEIIPA